MRIFAGKGAVVAALALGALTSYLAWQYVNQANASAARSAQTTPVVVAAMPIPARTVLGPEMVRIQRVPADIADPKAARSADEVVGKVARSAMTTDEPVLSTKLFLQRGESGLAFMVPEGMRAVSVTFNEVIGSGGMVAPGDHVDVLGVFEKTEIKDGKEDTTNLSTIVLQDVPVLAVAQRLEGEDTRPKETLPLPKAGAETKASQVRSEPTPMPAAKTATLSVSPSDALKLVLAEDQGKIRLALRRNDDKDAPQIAYVPVDSLYGTKSR